MFSKILNLITLKALGAILGLIYSILIIYYFGKSRTVEIFFVSNSLLYIITSLTQSGQLSEIFLPEYTRLKHSFGADTAYRAFSVVITRLLCWMIFLLVIFMITADYWATIMASSFTNEDQQLIASMFRVMLLQFVLVIINSFINTVLNAEKVYGKSEMASIINGLLNISSLILLYPYMGIWVLVFSLLIGRIAELSFSWILLKKINFKYTLLFRINEFDHSKFFSVVKHTFLYVGATQLFYIVFTSIATSLAPGIYAIFSHIQNLIGKIQSIILGPISTVFFSEYSNKTHGIIEKNKISANALLESTIIQSFILMTTVICVLGPVTTEFMQALLYNKNLSEIDIRYAALLFHLFMFNILFSAIGSIFRKAIISKGYSKTIYSQWTIIQLFSCLLTYLLIGYGKETGLLFINPLNILLLNSASFFVYFKTQEHKISINLNTIIKVILASCTTYCIIYFSRTMLLPHFDHWLILGILFPIGILIQTVLLKVLGVINMFTKIRSLVKAI